MSKTSKAKVKQSSKVPSRNDMNREKMVTFRKYELMYEVHK